MRHAIAAAMALALIACGEPDTGGGGGQDGMTSMPGMEMMPEMYRHMDSMAAMPPERMQAMMAAHQERASAMLDAMGAEMRRMNVTADPAWRALNDSVKRDLADLPGLRGKALTERMREHRRRMERLMNAHEEMMRQRDTLRSRPGGSRE